MRLSTSTNLSAVNRSGPLTDINESIRTLAEVGYRVLDINFRFIKFEEFFLARDDWERELDVIGNVAARYGVDFSQSHIPYYHPINEVDPYLSDPELHAWFERMCVRAYQASATLGVKWAVAHPFTAVEANCEREASIQKNLSYFAPYVDLVNQLGIGLAIENMSDFQGSVIRRRFAATYEDLITLVDAFHDESVGICWDFGHANIMGYDQASALTRIGHRLKATHVNDNFGVSDTHNLPFMGTVKWEDVMQALVAIGYEGDFTYEIHGMADRLPAALKPSALRYSYEVGQYLLGLANKENNTV